MSWSRDIITSGGAPIAHLRLLWTALRLTGDVNGMDSWSCLIKSSQLKYQVVVEKQPDFPNVVTIFVWLYRKSLYWKCGISITIIHVFIEMNPKTLWLTFTCSSPIGLWDVHNCKCPSSNGTRPSAGTVLSKSQKHVFAVCYDLWLYFNHRVTSS